MHVIYSIPAQQFRSLPAKLPCDTAMELPGSASTPEGVDADVLIQSARESKDEGVRWWASQATREHVEGEFRTSPAMASLRAVVYANFAVLMHTQTEDLLLDSLYHELDLARERAAQFAHEVQVLHCSIGNLQQLAADKDADWDSPIEV